MTLNAITLLATVAAGQVPDEIKIEIDWMATAGHSHQPSQAVLEAVVDMFACQGIQLTIDLSNEIPEIPTMQCPDPFDETQKFFECAGPSSFTSLKGSKNNDSTWHYCIFGHRYSVMGETGSSGLAEIGRDDFVVTLGSFLPEYGTEFERGRPSPTSSGTASGCVVSRRVPRSWAAATMHPTTPVS